MERPLPPLHLRQGAPSLLLCPLSVKLHATTVVMPLRPPARTGCSSRDGQLELAQEWLSSP
uniref:Uncharacterized protein n=1 Tax=Aegilops tauschii TaxID=37682 RepID=R7W238_AEGTA